MTFISDLLDPHSGRSFKQRVLMVSCLASLVLSTFIYLVNLKYHFPFLPALLLIFTAIISIIGLYFSLINRFLKQVEFYFNYILPIILAVMWFYKDGLFGSSPCLLLICYFISILISRKQKLFISFYFLAIFLILTYIQFRWPEYIHDYPSPIAQYISLFFSFILAALLSAFIMVMIRNNDAAIFKRLEENQNQVEKKYQLSTKANDKLNELILQKDQLLSIISHDSRAPIKNIESLLEMLIIRDISQNEMMALLPALREQVKETSLFMDNLLIWIKTQKEGFKPKLKRINVAAFLLKIQNLYQTGAELKEIKLKIENKVPGDLIIEDQMLHMILRNLVNNVHSPNKRTVSLIKN